MDEVYPDATIRLLVCTHADLAGNYCTAPPIGSVLLSPSGHLSMGPYCEEHLRVYLDRAQHGAHRVVWCSAETAKGVGCSVAPAYELNGQPYCYAHWRKQLKAQEEGRE